MFTKIVVAIDGSELSAKALEQAIVFGKIQNAEISLVHVVNPIPPSLTSADLIVSYEELTEEIRTEGQGLLDKAKARAEANGIAVTTHLITGDPAGEILDFSQNHDSELIVMGSRGFGVFKEMMLGSVSHRVSNLSECPVLIVK